MAGPGRSYRGRTVRTPRASHRAWPARVEATADGQYALPGETGDDRLPRTQPQWSTRTSAASVGPRRSSPTAPGRMYMPGSRFLWVCACVALCSARSGFEPDPWTLDGVEHYEVVFPRVVDRRQVGGSVGRWKRDGDVVGDDEDDEDWSLVSMKDWLLELRPNTALGLAPEVEWHSGGGWSSTEALRPCSLQVGRVRGSTDSLAAIAEADGGMMGLVRVDGNDYFLWPLPGTVVGGGPPPHALYRAGAPRDVSHDQVFSPLQDASQGKALTQLHDQTFPPTWDVTHDQILPLLRNVSHDKAFPSLSDLVHDQIFPLPRNRSLDQALPRPRRAKRESYLDHNLTVARSSSIDDDIPDWLRPQLEEVGYFLDAVWERDNMPLKHLVSPAISPPRWLELALAVDHSVIAFHCADRVQHYVIALMNIVSAIYKDSSLNSNLKLVIVRMIFYQDEAHNQVQEGNSKKSLENVNAWNQRLLQGLGAHERHDVAVWLTRLDLGGPSGYAPVSGACDPARSCTLNRDEGLTSAFIIAHEVAHVLGLSHDGDKAVGNDCGQEALMGSVMAPMVAATFHRFSWSRCSYAEFHAKAVKWKCLMNPPRSRNATHLNSTLQATYSMDEQCRLEFGDGYLLCRIFELPEPCSHLWCGVAGSDVCKTKKGPPLEGTECGVDRWCVNGYCELVDQGRFGPDQEPVLHNPRHGDWSDWGQWSQCSRSCGHGVRFRTRRCDNPRPEYGGDDCPGRSEELEVCMARACPEPRGDFRADQCRQLPRLLQHSFGRWLNLTWLPHEPAQASKKCQLICVSKETNKVFETGENLVDGTLCSYDGGNDICIQGDCQRMGCDGVLDSSAEEDWCGVCGGNGTGCINVTTTFNRKLRRQVTRVSVLPRLVRNIRLEVAASRYGDAGEVGVVLRDRRHGKQYSPANYSDDSEEDGENTLVVEGARFHHVHERGRHVLWAVGPILGELVLSVVVDEPAGVEVRCSSRYTVTEEAGGAAIAGRRYVWVEGGWGPCSRSCGGGRHQRTAACRDTHTGRLTSRGHCSLLAKPPPTVQKCNNFSCEFDWRPGPWEHCSATCGSRGQQAREVFCVHGPSNDTVAAEPWRGAMDPQHCVASRKPVEQRPCNREPCPVHWVPAEWSQCSATCGVGVETREFRCPAPRGEPLFDCGPSPPDQLRACRSRHRHRDPLCQPVSNDGCRRDASKYCGLTALLGRYCVLPGYHRLCCKTCGRLLA